MSASSQPNNLLTESAGIQAPLTSADQLVPGVFITTLAAQHIWEVMGPPEDGTVMLHRFDIVQPPPTHQHNFNQDGGRTCSCGRRVQRLTTLVPQEGQSPSVYVIAPPGGEVCPPAEPFTVYLTSSGQLWTPNSNGVPGSTPPIPLIALMLPIWSVPEELREWLL